MEEISQDFTIMWKNEKSVDVHISDNRRDVTIRKYLTGASKQPFMGGPVNMTRIYNFLKSRCYEDNYAGLDEVLEKAGMTWNNPWEWCKITHGVTYDDFLWIRYPDENDIKWEDVKVRD